MLHSVLIVENDDDTRGLHLSWLGEAGLAAQAFDGPADCLNSADSVEAELLCFEPAVLTSRAEVTALDELIRRRGRLTLLGLGDSPPDAPLRLVADSWLPPNAGQAVFLRLVREGIERSSMLRELSLLGRDNLRSRSSVETTEPVVRLFHGENDRLVDLLDSVNGRVKTFESLEMEIFNKARKLAGGNVTRTAQMLGVGRATIYRRMRAAAERRSRSRGC